MNKDKRESNVRGLGCFSWGNRSYRMPKIDYMFPAKKYFKIQIDKELTSYRNTVKSVYMITYADYIGNVITLIELYLFFRQLCFRELPPLYVQIDACKPHLELQSHCYYLYTLLEYCKSFYSSQQELSSSVATQYTHTNKNTLFSAQVRAVLVISQENQI